MQRKYVRSVFAGLTFLVSINFSAAFHLYAQTSPPNAQQSPPLVPTSDLPDPPYARVWYSKTESVVASCRSGIFDCVGLQSDQTVQVTVQCPAGRAFQKVTVQTLDGGTVARPLATSAPDAPTASDRAISLSTSADGTFTFVFQAGHNPGLNQVSLRQGSQELGLQFWVLDPQNPQNNPPILTPNKPSI